LAETDPSRWSQFLRQTVKSKDESMSEVVEVEVLTPLTVVGGVARPKGARVRVPRTEAMSEVLTPHVRIVPIPRLRCLVPNRVIGGKVCQPGEEADAPSLALAMEYHRLGSAEILNPDELGIHLPLRQGQRPADAPETLKLRALMRLVVTGLRKQNIAAGETFEVERPRAEQIVKLGHAEPVGWTMPAPRMVRVTALQDSTPMGGIRLNTGQSVDMTYDDYSNSPNNGRCSMHFLPAADAPQAVPQSDPSPASSLALGTPGRKPKST
jgi:hypothetical protein